MLASASLILSMISLTFISESKEKRKPRKSLRRERDVAFFSEQLVNLTRSELLHMKFAFHVGNAMFELFLVPHTRHRLSLKENQVGYILGYYGFVSLLSNTLLVPWISSYSVSYLLILLSAHSAGLLAWGLSSETAITVGGITLVAITSSLYINLIQALVAELGDPMNAGATMGLSAMVDRASRIIAPLIGGFTLQENSPISIGLAAFSFEVYSAIVLVVSTMTWSRKSSDKKKTE